MDRHELFFTLKKHPLFGRVYIKLTAIEIGMCARFIVDNDTCSKDEFAFRANRWFLDDPDKPTNHSIMWELVTIANQMFMPKKEKITASGAPDYGPQEEG